MTEHLIGTAKEIVDLGVEDPDLFVATASSRDRGVSNYPGRRGRQPAKCQDRSNSFTEVLARVFSSTRLTITAQ